ncbi:T9SS type A sorting domain-containing protein [Sabulilitoribacter arenilitoris]|uniref:T9SS type A sorting domain-containing protein n=1 Tax=Wocania arenilitoris TaxID=2044858 RepID=A0AAE3EKM7_9FLAO|nr:T9SS type A sorting domain-containing protein [Wocania arenilitoris]MCF7567028.1 T9SS type A sorting domain-containing protein [Wocania arenilitoris]
MQSQSVENNCGTITSKASVKYIQSIKPQLKTFEEAFLSSKFSKGDIPVKAINAIPVKAHIIRNSNGTGGISISELNNAISNLNDIYKDALMEFFLCDGINYIDENKLCSFNKRDESTLTEKHNVAGLINIYFTDYLKNSSDENICGYSNNVARQDVIIMKNDCVTNNSSLAHEMGHFFSLIHTHGPKNDTQTTELVDGSNCDTDGDGICDTPADPKLTDKNVNNFCEYIGTETDAHGSTFNPDTQNIMSYSKKGCRTHFTEQQLARMYAFFMTTKNYLSCPSFNADFTTDVSQTCNENLTVQFKSDCSDITKWEWDIDSDGVIDYTTQNPIHTYQSGIYNVTLRVSNKSKSINKTYSNYIKVGTQTDMLNENFDTFEIAGDKGWTANAVSKNGYNWHVNFGKTSTENTGPNHDNSKEILGKYIYAEASGAKPGDIAEFTSRCFTVDKENSELEFAYHMYGKGIGELHIDLKTKEGYINDVIPAIIGSQQNNQKDAFLTKSIDLSSYTHQTLKVRFRAVRGSSWEGDIAIDDVFIKTIYIPISDETYKVYPNPVKNNLLYVKTNDSKLASNYKISNLVGQRFLSGTVSNRPIDLSNLPSGTYLLVLNDGKSRVLKKIIK